MRRMWGTALVAGTLVHAMLPLAPQAADAIDLTGRWEGTEVCDELDSGQPGVFAETSPIFIQQRANGRFSMLFRLENGKANVIYEGLVRKVAGGGHEAIAIACGGAFKSQEVIRFRPVVAQGRQGLLNGESQFFTDDFPGAEGKVNFGTCKYAYQRVAVRRPTIERCTPSPIGAR